MVDREDLENAESRLSTAERKFESAGDLYADEVRQHPGAALTYSQRCIEHCAKSIFVLMGVQVPADHVIEVDSDPAKQLLNAVHADLDELYTKKTARLVFLTQIYGNAYPVSEYGIDFDQDRMEADDFLDQMEADQAYNHADEALTLARQIINVAHFDASPD